MPIAFTNCPACGGYLDANPKLIEGAIVIRCRDCHRYHLKGDDRLFEQHDGILDDLKARHEEIALIELMATEPEQTKALIESKASDPRWS
jgi:hypothetical protein